VYLQLFTFALDLVLERYDRRIFPLQLLLKPCDSRLQAMQL
jgi:hypothetical protein